jgi:hypothetical protein
MGCDSVGTGTGTVPELAAETAALRGCGRFVRAAGLFKKIILFKVGWGGIEADVVEVGGAGVGCRGKGSRVEARGERDVAIREILGACAGATLLRLVCDTAAVR